MSRFILRPLIAALCAALSVSMVPGLASAADKMDNAARRAKADATETVITVSSPQVGDSATFLVERETERRGSETSNEPLRPLRGQIVITVLSVDEDGKALHRVRQGPVIAALEDMLPTMARSTLSLESQEFFLEISDMGEVMEIVGFEDLFNKHRAEVEAGMAKMAPELSAKERDVQRMVADRFLTPEMLQSQMLDVVQLVYAAGSGVEYRAKTSTEPVEQESSMTGTRLKGVQMTRVETSRQSRSATIHTVSEVKRDESEEATAQGMSRLFKGTDFDKLDPAARRAELEKARKWQLSMREELMVTVEDGQAWLRTVTHRHQLASEQGGLRTSSVTETRVRRVDGSRLEAPEPASVQ